MTSVAKRMSMPRRRQFESVSTMALIRYANGNVVRAIIIICHEKATAEWRTMSWCRRICSGRKNHAFRLLSSSSYTISCSELMWLFSGVQHFCCKSKCEVWIVHSDSFFYLHMESYFMLGLPHAFRTLFAFDCTSEYIAPKLDCFFFIDSMSFKI